MVPRKARTEVVATSDALKPGFLGIKRSNSSTSPLIDCHGERDMRGVAKICDHRMVLIRL